LDVEAENAKAVTNCKIPDQKQQISCHILRWSFNERISHLL